jgi:hypothetical protein
VVENFRHVKNRSQCRKLQIQEKTAVRVENLRQGKITFRVENLSQGKKIIAGRTPQAGRKSQSR